MVNTCCFIELNIGLGILIVGLLALFMNFVLIRDKIMECLKIEDVHGSFSKDDQGTRFKLFAHIVNNGLSNIEITDIKVQINGARKLSCFLQGCISRREDTKEVIVTSKSHHHDHINLMLLPTEKNLKITDMYLHSNNSFNEPFIESTLKVITKPNAAQHFILFRILSIVFYKKKYKFQFKKTGNIKMYEGFEIPLIEKN